VSLASSIQDFGTFETHETFASRLHAKHGRKTGFWAQVAELSGSRRWSSTAVAIDGHFAQLRGHGAM
jgi:hypothetical protein